MRLFVSCRGGGIDGRISIDSGRTFCQGCVTSNWTSKGGRSRDIDVGDEGGGLAASTTIVILGVGVAVAVTAVSS